MTIKATFDNVLIKMDLKDKSDIIVLTEEAKKQANYFEGEVVAIGPDYPDDTLNVGDRIVYPPNEGFPVEIKGDEYLCLSERWVLGVVV